MNMAPASTDLDRLIEEGLTLYGQGDLDGALLVWEQVLSVEPDNAQANSYVDYVRMNYELLTSDLGDEDAAPFGIAADGEPEYQIEIMPSEAPAGPPPLQMDPLDEGWFIGEEQAAPGRAPAPPPPVERLAVGSDSAMTLELEADEPPQDPSSGAVSFEDATSEYMSGHKRSSEPTATGEFSPEATPGFGPGQATEHKRRDLGFVRPTASAGLEPQEPARKRTPSAGPPELQITLRTPQHGDEVDTAELGPARSSDPFDQSYAAHEIELPSRGGTGPVTRDLPAQIVPPHQKAAFDAIDLDVPIEPPPPLQAAPTRELSIHFAPSLTQDFGDRPTKQVDRPPSVAEPTRDLLVSAPTRELGLRGSVAGRTPTEDQPTLTGGRHPVEVDTQGTRHDIVLPFDPIDARTAQILDEVDVGAPTNEAREDKTRRRISVLIDQAQVWAATGELDKAVAAVDLALSEDPNSALAQKLIHRNRDTILSVFQSFLGDLDRQPALARPLHELGKAPISPRAAFLLSRVDGSLTLDEILDVSGMPRLESYRYLCQLFLRGILR